MVRFGVRSHGTQVSPWRFVACYFDRLALFCAPRFVLFYHFAMAIVLTAEQHAEAFKKAGADILFLMDLKNVDVDFQAKLYHHIGVISVELFAVFAKDQDVLEGLLAVHFEVPQNVLHRVIRRAGSLLGSWPRRARSNKPSSTAIARPGRCPETSECPMWRQ